MSTEVQTTTAEPQTLQLRAETSIDYDKEKYKYERYLSHFTPGTQPPLEEFEHVDVGLRADPEKKNLLQAPGVNAEEITPAIGTEIHGIQLSKLNSAQLDDLALLAAERGVVLFHDQDFADIGPERQREYGKHFGPLHVHQMGGQIKDYPELLPVYRDFTAGAVDNEIKDNITSVKWHSDMSYEINGMGTTTFLALSTPSSGGDTLYLSTTAAYYALSDTYRTLLHGLKAVHSGFSQASVHDHRERYIREPIETVHPVVRTHPVTKKLSLYVNRLYTKRIVGMKQEESASLLNFLFDHIERGQDWHLRVHWKPGTVVVYDNRNTQHSALRDFRVEEGTTRRHMLRITPQAERPYFEETKAE
ncbi:alpha-ketoglutarate-dependent taurine dioxygenase [Colletotrichum karsti]|uniref:Alpha-ketoglutarate-dependent taurine dioxygenase n=1 Tax=Colletotrichum karsti TaxID=1095194 RepID=A0A9P6LI74_9PEZI|nr:alpha-ketoglutarate-dependent taurine dioxygenase [Colletotrichum karsti]KAF9873961.1 alpha-ketoglutarate-dependent taurine dioxygenase [Colletotrichum karsti]